MYPYSDNDPLDEAQRRLAAYRRAQAEQLEEEGVITDVDAFLALQDHVDALVDERMLLGDGNRFADYAYAVFCEDTVTGGCTTETLIATVEEMASDIIDDIAGGEEVDLQWWDPYEWDRDAAYDTLFDIRSLPEAPEPPIVTVIPTPKRRRTDR